MFVVELQITTSEASEDVTLVVAFPSEQSYKTCKDGLFRSLPIPDIVRASKGKDYGRRHFIVEEAAVLPVESHVHVDYTVVDRPCTPPRDAAITNRHMALVAACLAPKKPENPRTLLL